MPLQERGCCIYDLRGERWIAGAFVEATSDPCEENIYGQLNNQMVDLIKSLMKLCIKPQNYINSWW